MEENNQEQNQEMMQGESIAKEQKQETTNAMQGENTTPKFTPLGQINEPTPKKKKGKVGAVIFILLLLVAIIGGLAYYYFQVYTNPKIIYQQIIKSGINSLTKNEEDMTTVKAKAKLDMNIELDEAYMEDGVEEILDLVNEIDATVEMQIDTNEKKALVKLASNYEKEALLKCEMLFDATNQGAYVKLEQFFDNVLEVEMEEGYFEELKEALEVENATLGQKINSAKVNKILNEEFVKIIKDEYCSKEKEKITVNSKEINVDKYILKITFADFIEELETTLENLKNNEEYLNCFKEKEEQKQQLEDAIEKIRELEREDEAILYVKLYKAGIKQELIRVDFEVEVKEEKLILKVEKEDNLYDYEISFEGETYCKGIVKTEKLKDTTKLNFTLDVEETVEAEFNIEYGYSIDEPIDTMDTTNAVKEEELTDADMLKVYTNLQQSKLYEFIEKFSVISDSPEVEENEKETPDITDNSQITSDVEKNISASGILTEGKTFIVSATNNNEVPVDMDIEVEYYDENGKFLGSCTEDYLMGIGAGREIAIEMEEVPDNFATYKIYVDAEETTIVKEYFEDIEIVQHNNNGKNIVVQVKNNSESRIENMSVCVLYYKQEKIVGIADETVFDVKSGRTGNFNLDFPYDSNYEEIEFDDYKVIVTEAYSYVY